MTVFYLVFLVILFYNLQLSRVQDYPECIFVLMKERIVFEFEVHGQM